MLLVIREGSTLLESQYGTIGLKTGGPSESETSDMDDDDDDSLAGTDLTRLSRCSLQFCGVTLRETSTSTGTRWGGRSSSASVTDDVSLLLDADLVVAEVTVSVLVPSSTSITRLILEVLSPHRCIFAQLCFDLSISLNIFIFRPLHFIVTVLWVPLSSTEAIEHMSLSELSTPSAIVSTGNGDAQMDQSFTCNWESFVAWRSLARTPSLCTSVESEAVDTATQCLSSTCLRVVVKLLLDAALLLEVVALRAARFFLFFHVFTLLVLSFG